MTGSTSCVANAGWQPNEDGGFEQCPVGHFKASDGNVACEMCGETSYSSIEGADACQDCPIGSVSNSNRTGCEANKGYILVSGDNGDTFEKCPVNTYKSEKGNTSCIDCANGRFSLSGSTSADDCLEPSTTDSLIKLSTNFLYDNLGAELINMSKHFLGNDFLDDLELITDKPVDKKSDNPDQEPQRNRLFPKDAQGECPQGWLNIKIPAVGEKLRGEVAPNIDKILDKYCMACPNGYTTTPDENRFTWNPAKCIYNCDSKSSRGGSSKLLERLLKKQKLCEVRDDGDECGKCKPIYRMYGCPDGMGIHYGNVKQKWKGKKHLSDLDENYIYYENNIECLQCPEGTEVETVYDDNMKHDKPVCMRKDGYGTENDTYPSYTEFLPQDMNMVPCPKGTYYGKKDGYGEYELLLQCRACPHGKTTANVGSTTVDDCI